MTQDIHYERLRDADLFQDLSDSALIELSRHCRWQELPAGETLFQQGDPGDTLYLLTEGQIQVVRHYDSGEDVVLGTYGPFYVVGELSGIVDQPRTGSTVAVSDCTLITLSRQALMDICAQSPEIAMQLLQHIAQRLYRVTLQVREHALGNVAARVASLLLLMSGGEGGVLPGSVRVNRIARATAAHADVVDRLLAKWQQAGYILLDGRQMSIVDLEAIRDIAG